MKKSIKILTISIAIAILLFAAVLPPLGALAESTLITDVLVDLQSDKTFDVNDYPCIDTDYSLSIIQIAETTAQELFVYVYNPSCNSKPLIAIGIVFSTAINENLSYKTYDLKLLSSDGPFAKYVVHNFVVKEDALRYYDISELYRSFDETIDLPAEDSNTINEVSCPVAQLWCASTVQDVVTYEMSKTEILTITDKYVGVLQYPDGFYLHAVEKVNSHFVAFSTDYDIDYLLEAQVEFLIQKKNQDPVNGVIIWPAEQKNVTLAYSDTVTVGQSGLFSKTYVWNRIESVSTFMKNEDLTDEAIAELSGKQWVLRFVETNYSSMGVYHEWYSVSEVTILRLKFQTAGITYNLGVIDNKQTGDGIPDNNEAPIIDFSWLEDSLSNFTVIIFSFVLGILVIAVFCFIVYFLLRAIFKKS